MLLEKRPDLATIGDQKYLELFDEKFGAENIEILCHKVGNGAPWNFPMLEFNEDNKTHAILMHICDCLFFTYVYCFSSLF